MSFDVQSYLAWRSKIPFTDEQIAAQLDADADALERGDVATHHNPRAAERVRYLRWRAHRVRQGRLMHKDFTEVVDALVKFCWCGKKALYRSGTEGRCREHRVQTSPEVVARQARLEARSQEIERAVRARDRESKRERSRVDMTIRRNR